MGKRKDANLAAIRKALDRAREHGAMETDWLGEGSDRNYAEQQEREYLELIDAGLNALEDLHGVTAGVVSGSTVAREGSNSSPPCPTCSGSGRVTIGSGTSGWPPRMWSAPCATCNGSGNAGVQNTDGRRPLEPGL